MPDIVRDPAEVTGPWLSAVLREQGCLRRGDVASVDCVGTLETATAQLWQLAVRYSGVDCSEAPTQLVLKSGKPDVLASGKREYMVYAKLSSMSSGLPIAPCYHAGYCDQSRVHSLLLEDLSDSHYTPPYGVPPSKVEARAMVDCLGTFHAKYWDDPPSTEDLATLPTEFDVRRSVGHATCYWPRMADFLGDRVEAKGRQLIDLILERYADLVVGRIEERRHLTMVHGDAHAQNFVLPRRASDAQTYLIDWQTGPWVWQRWVGVSDLAYLMTRFWDPDRRRQLERSLLECYQSRLRSEGVVNYDWAMLWDDYRLCVMSNLCLVIEEFVHSDPWKWYPQLRRLLEALVDLECEEVLLAV